LAERLGLKAGPSAPVRTASGNIVVHLTTLQHVELGNISLYNIAANINPYMHGDAILLGLSFLKHVQFTQRDDVLTLRQVKKNTVPDSPDA
jgi:aspartyl protease family protein